MGRAGPGGLVRPPIFRIPYCAGLCRTDRIRFDAEEAGVRRVAVAPRAGAVPLLVSSRRLSVPAERQEGAATSELKGPDSEV
jgi:hypothetical protein